MRIIKLAIISFVFLFLIVTAISLMIPSQIRISKAINVGNDRAAVWAIIKDTSRWKEWHPAFENDSFRKTVSILPQLQSDSQMVYKLVPLHKRPVVNGWQLYGHPTSDSLTLQWYMDFTLPWYPWQKFGSLFYENTYGVMMQQGLTNIGEKLK